MPYKLYASETRDDIISISTLVSLTRAVIRSFLKIVIRALLALLIILYSRENILKSGEKVGSYPAFSGDLSR